MSISGWGGISEYIEEEAQRREMERKKLELQAQIQREREAWQQARQARLAEQQPQRPRFEPPVDQPSDDRSGALDAGSVARLAPRYTEQQFNPSWEQPVDLGAPVGYAQPQRPDTGPAPMMASRPMNDTLRVGESAPLPRTYGGSRDYPYANQSMMRGPVPGGAPQPAEVQAAGLPTGPVMEGLRNVWDFFAQPRPGDAERERALLAQIAPNATGTSDPFAESGEQFQQWHAQHPFTQYAKERTAEAQRYADTNPNPISEALGGLAEPFSGDAPASVWGYGGRAAQGMVNAIGSGINAAAPVQVAQAGSILQGLQKYPWATPVDEFGELLTGNYTGERGDAPAVSDVTGAAGAGINKTFNPLNPNMEMMAGMPDTPEARVVQWATGWLRPEAYTQAYDIAKAQYDGIQELRPLINAAAQDEPRVAMSLLNNVSGPESMERTRKAIDERDEVLAQLEAQRAQALQNGDSAQIAELTRNIQLLESSTAADLVDQNANPWAELAEGIFDISGPFTDLLKPLTKGAQVARQVKKAGGLGGTFADVARQGEAAAAAMEQAMRDGEAIVKAVTGGQPVDVRSLGQKLPGQLDPDALADRDRDRLAFVALRLLADTPDKQTARLIMETWLDNPRLLATDGLPLPNHPNADQATGLYFAGPGMLKNPKYLESVPVLQASRDELLAMPALQGEGMINPNEVETQFYNITQRNALKFYGVTGPTLPQGATKARAVRMASGRGALEYTDDADKVVDTVEFDTFKQARDQAGKITSAAANPTSRKQLPFVMRFAKGIMNDAWLGFNVKGALQNGIGGAVQVFANDALTFEKVDDLIAWNQKVYGDFYGDPRLAERGIDGWKAGQPIGAEAEAGGSALGMLAQGFENIGAKKFGQWGKKKVEQMYNIPYGAATPLSEQNLAARLNIVTKRRFAWDQIKATGANTLKPELRALGLDDEMTDAFADAFTEAAMYGGRRGLTQKAREMAHAMTLHPSVETMGVAPETLKDAGREALLSAMIDPSLDLAGKKRVAQIIFEEERKGFAEILLHAPPQPGQTTYAATEAATDSTLQADVLIAEARREGALTPELATEIKDASRAMSQAVSDALDGIADDIGNGTQVNLDAINDFYVNLVNLRTRMRRTVDEAAKAARNAGNKADKKTAWENKWAVNRKAWSDFADGIAASAESTRGALFGETPQGPKVDLWRTLDEQMRYDQATFDRYRRLNERSGNLRKLPEAVADKMIDQERSVVDRGFARLMQTFRQVGSGENVEVLFYAMRTFDEEGARAGKFLSNQRDIAYDLNTPEAREAYYALRNKTWTGLFDETAKHAELLEQVMLRNGVAEMVANELTFIDSFGRPMETMFPAGGGRWAVRNMDTGKIDYWFDPGKAPKDANPGMVLPQEMADSYRQGARMLAGTDGDALIDDALATTRREIPDDWLPPLRAGQVEPEPVPTPSAAPQLRMQGTWRNAAGDEPVVVTGVMGETDGVRYYSIEGSSTGIPETEFVPTPSAAPNGVTQGVPAPAAAPVAVVESPPPPVFYNGVTAGDPKTNGKRMSQAFARSKRQGHNAPTGVGDTAADMLRLNREAEARVMEHLDRTQGQGVPNRLTPQQRAAVVKAADSYGRTVDDVYAASAEVGKTMADWGMLNYGQGRIGDYLLKWLSPYPHFFTRMPSRMLRTAMTRPDIVNAFYEVDRAISNENERAQVPQRLEGTIGIPPIGPWNRAGIGAVTASAMPYRAYVEPSEYVRADEEPSGWYRPIKRAQEVLRMGTWPQATWALDFAADITDPLPDGTKRTAAHELGDVIPHYRGAGYLYSGLTGKQPWGAGGKLAAGDEFDPYRIGRSLAVQGYDEQIDPVVVKWAQEIVMNEYNGRPLEQGIPPQYLDQAMKLKESGTSQAMTERAGATAVPLATGVKLYNYEPGEADLNALKQYYRELGYDPLTNPGGSRAQKLKLLEVAPELTPSWSASSMIPGADGSPRESASRTMRTRAYAEVDVRQQAEVDQLILLYEERGETAPTDEVNAIIFDKYGPERDAIRAQYEWLPKLSPTRQGMNPREEAQSILEGILGDELPDKPARPGGDDDAAFEALSMEEKRAYWDADAKWSLRNDETIRRRLEMLANLMPEESGVRPEVQLAIQTLLEGQYATDLTRRYKNQYVSDIQYRWAEQSAFEKELDEAERQAAQNRVRAELGEAGVLAMRAYNDADTEGRKEMGKDPLTFAARMVTYNPDEWKYATAAWGKDWHKVLTNAPQNPGKKNEKTGEWEYASEAQKQAHRDRMNAYEMANPRYAEMDLWYNGRNAAGRRGGYRADDSEDGKHWEPDYGEDMAQLLGLWPNTFTNLNISKQAWARYNNSVGGNSKGKDNAQLPQNTVANWDEVNTNVSAYYKWLYEFDDKEIVRPLIAEPPTQRVQNYGGERPVGSGLSPVLEAGNVESQPPDFVREGVSPPFLTEAEKKQAATGQPPTKPKKGAKTDTKSMLEYAERDEKFVENRKKDAEFARNNAEWVALQAEGIKLFGEDIWDISKGYDADWSKEQKDAYLAKYPQLRAFWDWRYGDDGKGGKGSASAYAGGAPFTPYPRSSYGGGGGGGGYGGDPADAFEMSMDVRVDPRMFNQNLMPQEQDIRSWQPWREAAPPDWLRAGDRLQYQRFQNFQAPDIG